MDFEALYQEIILDHTRRPRNFGEMEDADVKIHADNPLCGDDLTVYVKFNEDGSCERLGFTGSACSICLASASMMTVKLKNKSEQESQAIAGEFVKLLTAEEGLETEPDSKIELGELKALMGVRKFPMRTKCATLAWHAFEQALESKATGAKEGDLHVE